MSSEEQHTGQVIVSGEGVLAPISDEATQFYAQEDACTHPEIVEEHRVMTREITVRCSQCQKKVAIPLYTLILADNEDDALAGIIGMAFGEAWEERIRAYRKQMRERTAP